MEADDIAISAKRKKSREYVRKIAEKEARTESREFWMVAGNSGPSRKRYKSMGAAIADAVSLANEFPPFKFHVTHAIGFFQRKEAPITAANAQSYPEGA